MKKNCFTFVELLVVIATIGILTTMLMPSISKARKLMSSAVYKNNQSNLGKAFYLNENKGKFPATVSADVSWLTPIYDSPGTSGNGKNIKLNSLWYSPGFTDFNKTIVGWVGYTFFIILEYWFGVGRQLRL